MTLSYETKKLWVEQMPDDPNLEKGDVQVASKDGDAALGFLAAGIDAKDMEPLTEEQSKALLRRIDFMVVPLMALIYGLQYIDKVLINYAAVMVSLPLRSSMPFLLSRDSFCYQHFLAFVSDRTDVLFPTTGILERHWHGHEQIFIPCDGLLHQLPGL
jgi:hypothetical protein